MSVKRKFVPRQQRESKREVKRLMQDLTKLENTRSPASLSHMQATPAPASHPAEGPSAARAGLDLPAWRQDDSETPIASSSTPSYESTYSKPRAELDSRDYRIICKDYNLTGAPNPLRSWADAELGALFKTPTAIQAGAIPLIVAGKDMVGVAPTGSGKTLAFVLPPSLKKLVLSPTRELAVQTCRVFEANGVRAVALIGGHDAEQQRSQLRNAQAIIATPGRLIDFMENERLDLSDITLLVLDEADRMLDMGFEDALGRVKAALGPSVQTVMFTATWDDGVQKVAEKLLTRATTIRVGATLNNSITQTFEWTVASEKQAAALKALKRLPKPCIVFCNTKAACDALGLPAIHSGRAQREREHTLREFAQQRIPAICATDVIGRGIDISVRSVLNYDMPNVDTFVHRVGRTGRAGNRGVAHTLLEERDKSTLLELKKLLRDAGVNANGLESVTIDDP